MELAQIAKLGPDACRHDRCAPCYYLHLKRWAMNGERDTLSPSELLFVGFDVSSRRDTGGWHQLDGMSLDDGEPSLSADELATYQALTQIPNAYERRFEL